MLVACLMVPVLARAANISLVAGDAVGATSFSTAGNWSNAAVPNSANDYFTSAFGLRTPGDANNYTFAGKSLTLQAPATTGYSIIYKGTAGANTYTINNLTNNGGLIRSGAGSVNTCIIAGTMAVTGNSTIDADQSPFIINANLSGSGVLTNLNPGPQTYGTVTYGGTNSAFTGELWLAANAVVIFANTNSAPGNPSAPNPGQITLGANSTLQDSAGVVLKNSNGGITLAGSATINVSGSNVATTVAVPVTGGGNNLTKVGTGTLYLDATNTYTGTTTVTAGTVAGAGTLNGPVVVGAAGNLGAGDAGAAIGTLTINNTLSLLGNVTLRVNSTGGSSTNDQVTASGSLTYGGTLTIANITSDGTPLPAGGTFQLFNTAGSWSGGFKSILGSPGPGRAYTFNPTNGVLTVVSTLALVPLTHRYSFFSEPNGSLIATDTVAAANGSLAGSANITGGKLVLNGTSGTYANLPGGLISNFTAVTMEAWADFGSLPANCYLFSFGLTDASSYGGNYIFCAPQAARITISGADPGFTSGAEQNAATSGWSGKTNLHVVAIFNPPAGTLAIYTNGYLAALNNAETTSLSAVSNVLSYLGRSLYTSDPYAPMNLYEFRIWGGAMTPSQIALDAAAGPGQLTFDPGPLQVLHLTLTNQMPVNGSVQVYNLAPGGSIAATAGLLANGTQQAVVTGDFTNISGVNLLGYNPPTFTSGNTAVLTVNASGLVTAVGKGTTTITATYGALSVTNTVTAVSLTNRFVFDSFGDGFWNIINQGNSNALVVGASSATQQIPTNGATQQEFEMLYNIQSNNFRIRQVSSWLCIGSTSGIKVPGTPVTTISYSGTASQQWNLQDAGGGYFRIVNSATNLVMQTDNGTPAVVTLAASNASPNQLWKFVYQAHYPKKGIAGYENEYAQFELTWAYNYDDNTGVSLPAAVNFGPMIHDSNWEPISDVTSRSAGWRTQSAPNYLLTYNEPDNTSEANMSTNQTIGLWPALQALNVPLVGPGTQNIQDAWENNFFSLIAANGYRVDYSAVHDYVPPNTSGFISNLRSVYNAYGRPVWVTEFSPVDWNGNQGWTEDDDYNFLAEFMWQAEDQDWLKRYAIFPFTGTNALPPYQSTTAGYRGNYFLTGTTLSPYGELYATWDADRALHPRIQYILHNLASSFRLTATNGVSSPLASTIYVRNATTEWALLAAPTTNHWYLISLNDGRRLSDTGGTLSLQPVGTLGAAVEWTFTGPDSSGYYFIGNAAGAHNLNGAGTAPAITFSTVSSATQNNNTRWRLVKPYQAVTMNTNDAIPATPLASAGNANIFLSWTGGGGAPYFNVYRSTTSGGPYTKISSAQKTAGYQDNAVANGVAYYYVVTSMNILGEESAFSGQATGTPVSTAPTNIAYGMVSGNNVQLSWPGDHTGWRLQVQTNDLDTGLGTNWLDVTGSTLTNQIMMPLDPANGSVFYRLVYP